MYSKREDPHDMLRFCEWTQSNWSILIVNNSVNNGPSQNFFISENIFSSLID